MEGERENPMCCNHPNADHHETDKPVKKKHSTGYSDCSAQG
ncbi:hypothetical protein SynBIOSE41_03118 [Synechococcus sp. BIOS-E4-1]|nr:hypothetical protein SynBIOSE41_03118 [Synechococcus sp. BIOS-E4-1]